MAIVYLLTNIENGKRYVGKTKGTLDARWYSHCYSASRGSPYAVHAAIRKYGGKSFNREVLGEYPTEEEALAAEREWVERLGTMGSGGYNLCEGGRGAIGYKHTDEERARFSARAKEWMSTPEGRARKSEAAKAQWANPEVAAKNRTAIEAARATPEVRAKMSAAVRASHNTPEYLAQAAATRRGVWQRPGFRERTTEAIRASKASPEARAAQKERSIEIASRPEIRAARAVTSRAMWADPVKRAELEAALALARTPERAARISAANKVACNTPEFLAKMREIQNSPERQAQREAMKQRPCKHCGGPRVMQSTGHPTCRPCMAAREKARLHRIRGCCCTPQWACQLADPTKRPRTPRPG